MMCSGKFLAIASFVALAAAASVRAEEPGFKPIFDGRSLTGWRGEEGVWRIEDGAIVGESTPDKPLDHNTFLVWDDGTLDDFVLRLEFRLTSEHVDSANGGIQFRSAMKPDGHVFGYQADIDLAGKWVGAVYDELGRGVLAARGQKTAISEKGARETDALGDPAVLLESVRKNDWNDYEIMAQGGHITLKINGQTTAEVNDLEQAERDLTGLLALQLHEGPSQKMQYRNLRLKRLALSDGRKKAVFFAGTPSHGAREHEHNAGCLLLARELDSAIANGLPALTTVYRNGWPHDPTALDNADTVVFYCDGGPNHFVNDHLEEFQRLVDKGIGLVCLHYGVEVPKGPSGEKLLDWIGGYFEPDWSVNPHWTASFKLFPDHPVARGVKPFEINDEWYYHMRFAEGMKGVTPILTDLPPRDSLDRQDGPHEGNPAVREAVLVRKEPQHMAWAYDRPDGKGRGFGFTGGHFHRNWQNDQFRKVVLNAIAWTAGLDVPAEGIETPTPTDEEMLENLDPKGQARRNARIRARTVADSAPAERAKAPYSSALVTSATPGHAVDIDVDITGAKKLFLIVTDGGNGFSCDWADWIEPRVTGPGGEKPLTDLDWKSARSDWGSVRKNQRVDGGPLEVHGAPVPYGIGAHAVSVIEFELPGEFTRFQARGGLDAGGIAQGGGQQSSVQFHVFTQAPGAALLASPDHVNAQSSREAADAVAQLDVHPGLECSLFAAEPLMANPTNIEVDHRGRVWICEVVNYRRFRNGDLPERTEGDRILVLEDADGDGRADKSTTFYQGRDIDSAHGILLMPTLDGKGTKALISARDQVFYLIDDDGDLKSDRKEVLFTGISGTEHDHGIHAFVFGPDGKLYFNFGNAGEQIRDRDGKAIIDKAGNEVAAKGTPYRQGMVFRCNVDGSEFETLGWNFRNNWELAVDSFGTIWQSDNDDDGNRGVRINYVMEYGNYGYQDEMTGAAWSVPRTGWEAEIPRRHWHQNDPGVIPNLLTTGNGSPTGICVYEGTLLPEVFRGNLIHCDAGPNIVRSYTLSKEGAGYTADVVDVLSGARDQWFRPTDVCVAPDGSLMISDWYDPGVGGHRMEDIDHGRLFRVAPPGTPYTTVSYDLGNPNGAIAALQSPNSAWRYLGWQALHEMGAAAEPAVAKAFGSASPRQRARMLWMFGALGLPADVLAAHLRTALDDDDADLRITAIRLLRQKLGQIDLSGIHDAIDLEDPSAAVRRELLIGLHGADVPGVAGGWSRLAQQYTVGDRWYLEALGIGASGRWAECLTAWLDDIGNQWDTRTGRDIIWRSRAPQTPELLAKIISDPGTTPEDLPRYFRALDFLAAQDKAPVLMDLALHEARGSTERKQLIATEALNRLEGIDPSDPEFRGALDRVLKSAAGTTEFISLVNRFNRTDQYAALLGMAQQNPESQLGVEAIRTLLTKDQRALLEDSLNARDATLVTATMQALATAADNRSLPLLLGVLQDPERGVEVRREAVRALGSFRGGAEELRAMAERQNYDGALRDSIAATLHGAQWPELKQAAASLFPSPPSRDNKPLPTLSELLERGGDAANGRIVFHTTGTCATCHLVNGLGREVGPNLSEIGRKLTKQAMYESILFPSAGISHNFETWTVATVDGNVFTGIITSETPEELTLKDAKAILRTIRKEDIEQQKKSDASLMPADLQKILSEQELIDVVEFLTTLKGDKGAGS